MQLSRESLGFDYDEEKTLDSLKKILSDIRAVVLVAESNKSVLGYIHASLYQCTYSDLYANNQSLAVDNGCKRMGIGKKLLYAAEKWARGSGCRGIRLDSNIQRLDAHRFYEACGYTNWKDYKNFRKRFDEES
jgi:predicted N-acetyltransferase YhbS